MRVTSLLLCFRRKQAAEAAPDGADAKHTPNSRTKRVLYSAQTAAVSVTSKEDKREVLIELMKYFDSRLRESVRHGSIRFLNVTWLLEQPDDYQLEPCQALEAREAQGEPIFLTPEHAEACMLQCNRSLASVSYGWAARGEADPTGARLRAIRTFLRSNDMFCRYQGLFWDCMCIPQWPRTPEEGERFADALRVMGLLYASPLATSVFQMQFLPEMPPSYAGRMFIDGLPLSATEASVRSLLGKYKAAIISLEIERIHENHPDRTSSVARVTLATHKQAAAAVEAIMSAVTLGDHKHFATLAWNARPSEERGWVSI